MSSWLVFSVDVREDSKISIRRAVETIWGKDEVMVGLPTLRGLNRVTYQVSLCRDGVEEFENIRGFLKYVKGRCSYAEPFIQIERLDIW